MTDVTDPEGWIDAFFEKMSEHEKMEEYFFGPTATIPIGGEQEITLRNELIFDVLGVLYEHDEGTAKKFLSALIGADYGRVERGVSKPSDLPGSDDMPGDR